MLVKELMNEFLISLGNFPLFEISFENRLATSSYFNLISKLIRLVVDIQSYRTSDLDQISSLKCNRKY